MSERDGFTEPVTALLNAMTSGSPDSAQQLLDFIYDELRRIARSRLGHMDAGSSMNATALVHEAWLRIGDANCSQWDNRGHFFGAAARAMRQILVDQHRRKRRIKHGGDLVAEQLHSQIETPVRLPVFDLIALDEALDRLETAHERPARIVMMRYFAGATQEDVALMLNVSKRTVEREWRFARAWLQRALA